MMRIIIGLGEFVFFSYIIIISNFIAFYAYLLWMSVQFSHRDMKCFSKKHLRKSFSSE